MKSTTGDFEFYEKDGKRYDRITSLLDYFATPDLVAWKMRVGKAQAGKVSRAALKCGNDVDTCIRASIGGHSFPKLKSHEAESCYGAFVRWICDYGMSPTILRTIGPVFHEVLCVAGTPDLILGNIVIDIKCSSFIRPSYWLQTEFYGRCISPIITHKAILRLDKNLGIYEFKTMSLSEEHWAATQSLITAVRYFKSFDKEGKEESYDSTVISAANSPANAT